MRRKPYFLITGAIFLLISIAHLSRLLSGWEIAIAGRSLPRWLSLPGLIVTGCLAAWGFALARKKEP